MKYFTIIVILYLAGCATEPPPVQFAPQQSGPVAPYLGK